MKASLSQIGRYRIEEKVGMGGMAAVYKGVLEGSEGFERRVAVKVLHPHLCDDEDYVRMFHEEARLAARLSHPVLVPVIDLGSLEGMPFMVMDFVEGATLAELYERYQKKKMPFPQGHALHILAQVLDGLDYVHNLTDNDGKSCNVIHRDVSPQNIVISRSGAVRLLDFGIARSDQGSNATRAGVVKGTIPYMPPEQARGDKIDHRADLFAVGMILHKLLTNEIPLKATDIEEQREELAENRISVAQKKVHLKLRPILNAALAANADDRFDTAKCFSEALKRMLEELEPTYEPVKLIGLTGVRRRTRKKRASKTAVTRKPRQDSQFRKSRVDTPKKEKPAKTPLPPLQPWNGPRTVTLFATALLVVSMLYTFMSNI